MKSNATDYHATVMPEYITSTREHNTTNTRETTRSTNVEKGTPRDGSTPLVASSTTAIDENTTDERNNEPAISETSETRPDVLSDYMSYRIGEVIKIYAFPPIAVVGIVGNSISMLVMFQRDNRRTSFGVYVGVLAISDTLVLCIKFTNWLVRVLRSSPLRDVDCKVMAYLITALHMNGFFIIAGFTFDRLMAVRYPFKAMVWCTARRAKIVICIGCAVAFLLTVPFVILNHVENNVCAMGTPGSVASVVYPLLAVFFGLVVPFISLTSMNAVIIIGIRKRLQFRSKYAPDGSGSSAVEATEMSESATCCSQVPPQIQSVTCSGQVPPQNQSVMCSGQVPPQNQSVTCSGQIPEQNQSVTCSGQVPPQNQSVTCSGQEPRQIQSRDNRKIHSTPMTARDRNAIVVLLVVSVAFLLLVAPYFLRIALFSMTNRTRTMSVNADYMLFFQLSQKLYYANNACNFFLYCMSGTKFRNDVVRLFRGKSFAG